MLLHNVQLAFADGLFNKKKGSDDDTKPKYKASFILPKDHPQRKEVQAAMKKVANDKWPNGLPGGLEWCLRNGDKKKHLEGFAGNLFFGASNNVRPSTFDQGKNVVTEDDNILYSGCFVDVSVEFWAQDNKHGKRVNASLSGVQKRSDGPQFGGGGRAADADEFEDLSGEEGYEAPSAEDDDDLPDYMK